MQMQTNPIETFQYKGITEHLYTSDHPEILQSVDYFTQRYLEADVFGSLVNRHPERSQLKAHVAALEWFRFSEFAPWFDCAAAAQVNDNKKRHYLIQIAFEELGMGDEAQIHCGLFWEAAKRIGLRDEDKAGLDKDPGVKTALTYLRNAVLNSKSDAEVLGMMLGFEIPARENIELLLQSMAFENKLEQELGATSFFAIHRIIETEHVRLSVSNWLRFCKTEAEKKDFIKGADIGLKFWKLYWIDVCDAIDRKKRMVHA